jgi:hypothetical protein
MALPPLTHHDILGLIEPFTRRGRELDLAASDRIARRLVFKTVAIDGDATTSVLTDTLHIECLEDAHFALERTITHPQAMPARLHIEGQGLDQLMADIDAIDAHILFRFGPGYSLTNSYQLTAPNARRDGTKTAAEVQPTMRLTRAQLRVGELAVAMKMPAVKGYAAELELTSVTAINLPDDLLAVLGRDWACLSCNRSGWRGTLEVRGNEPGRSQHAASQLEAAGAHLALTLAQPPAQFHQRLKLARWRVAGRRSVPVLFLAGLMGAAMAVPHLGIAQDSALWMLIFNSPPLLLVFGLWLREIPSFSLPRPPKRLTAASWWPGQQEQSASAQPGTTSAGSPA